MTGPSGKKILVVDGDRGVSRQVAAWLKGEGVQVLVAEDGETGFMRFRKELPHAAIIAAQLDKVVGSVLCQRIKNNPKTANTLVLLASERYASHPELGERAVAMFAADGYLVKPINREALILALEPLLKSAAKSTDSTPEKHPTEVAAAPIPAAPQPTATPETGFEAIPEPVPKSTAPEKPPVHQGNLHTTPLPHLFINLLDLKRTGVLVLERNRIKREIYFHNGQPVHATSTLRTENPALMLVRDGVISEEEYSKSLVIMTEQGLGMNEALVAATALTYETLYERVRKYEEEVLVNCFAWHEGHFEFRPENRLADSVPSFDYTALKIMYEGVAKHYPLKLFSAPVHEHKEEYAVRTPRFAELIAQLNLEPSKLKFALLITGRALVRDLVTLGRDDLYGTYRLLWTLQLARMIEFSDEPRLASDADFLDKSAPSARKPLSPDAVAAITREYYRVKSSNYFRVLQVTLNAEEREIDKAFHEIEMKYHADSLVEYDIREVQGKLNEILDKARAAHRVLIDTHTRREYRHYLEVQERQRAKDEALQAEISFKEGEKALSKADFETARERFEAAIKMKPDEPDYYALLGWVLFQLARKSADRVAAVKQAKQELGKAIAMNPQADKAFLILGRLYAAEGNLKLAEEHFERALKANPDCSPAKVALDLISKGRHTAPTSPCPEAGP